MAVEEAEFLALKKRTDALEAHMRVLHRHLGHPREPVGDQLPPVMEPAQFANQTEPVPTTGSAVQVAPPVSASG